MFHSGAGELRGKAAVTDAWSVFFEGEAAPFSWAPDLVLVRDSGQLALSSGPVFGVNGQRVATFTSIWERQADGAWKIVFDKGQRYCEPEATGT